MKTRFNRARRAAWALAACASPFCHAQSSGTTVASLSETLVTATRTPQPLTDVVTDVTVIDRDTLQRSGATGIADVLSRVPGLSMARNGGPGSTTSLFVRGAESRFTAVLVDGIRIDSQSTGGAAWNRIPLAQIERIEIVRGPAAAVYGSDALGGVIQIFTRRGTTAFAPSVRMGVGSHGTRQLDLGLSGREGALDYAIGLGRDSTRGFNVLPAGNPDRDGHEHRSLSASLGWQLNTAHRLEATALLSDLDTQYDASRSVRDDHAEQRVQTLGLSWLAQWDTAHKSRLSVSQSRDRYKTRPSPYATDTHITSYLLHNEWQQGAHQWSADLERREDRLLNASTTPTLTRRSQDALALGYGLHSGDHTLQLNLRHDQDSEFGGNTTGSVGYAYALSPRWRASASAGTAFRVPTLFQRFSIYGTPELRAESGRNIEFGLKYATTDRNFGVVAYRNRVDNLITYVSGPGSCINGTGNVPGCYGNTARAQYSGLTFSGDQRLGRTLLRASLDVLAPKDLDTGKQLRRRARQQATLAAEQRWGAWQLGAEVQLVAHRFDDANNVQRLGGYGLLNLSVSTPVGQDWTLIARVDNLGDKAYQTTRGYATAGRTVYLGLKWAPQ